MPYPSNVLPMQRWDAQGLSCTYLDLISLRHTTTVVSASQQVKPGERMCKSHVNRKKWLLLFWLLDWSSVVKCKHGWDWVKLWILKVDKAHSKCISAPFFIAFWKKSESWNPTAAWGVQPMRKTVGSRNKLQPVAQALRNLDFVFRKCRDLWHLMWPT